MVAILGGTGSLGQALARTMTTQFPGVRLRIVARGEHRMAAMQQALGNARISYCLGDVRNVERLALALQGCDLVIHAAALKRIDLVEYNPYEAVATNTLGTWNVMQAAMAAGVEHVITVSTDKAVKPETLYGATKQVAERLTIHSNHYSPTGPRFCVVRYGNVAGSQGSVLPFWRACLAQGKPLPLTNATMTRFWITLDEAVAFILFVAHQPHRGAIFVPHLPAFQLGDLVRALQGLPPDAALEPSVTPIPCRGVEKWHEDLATLEEWGRGHWYPHEDPEREPYAYCIDPSVQHWGTGSYPGGWTPLAQGPPAAQQAYNSETWPWRLSVADLHARLGTVA